MLVVDLHAAVGVVLDGLRDVELVVEVADLLDERGDELLVRLAGKVQDLLGNVGVALGGTRVLGVPLDDLAQVHGVGGTVDDVAVLKGGTGLVGHGVDDAQQARGEGDAGDALGLVHVLTGLLVALIGLREPLDDLADAVKGVGVGEHGRERGDIGLHAVRQGIHAGVGAELGGHGVGELGVDDGDVRGDVEVGERVLDALGVVRDDGERGDLGGRAGSRGDGAEVGLLAQLGEGERLDDVVEGLLGVLVEDPHGLGGINRGATAEGDDPVRLELAHGLGALHDRLDGRVRLDALEQLDLKAGVLEVLLDVLQEAATTHGAAAGDDDGLGALEVLHLVTGALAEVQVTRIGKTTHVVSSNSWFRPPLWPASDGVRPPALPVVARDACPRPDRDWDLKPLHAPARHRKRQSPCSRPFTVHCIRHFSPEVIPFCDRCKTNRLQKIALRRFTFPVDLVPLDISLNAQYRRAAAPPWHRRPR